MLKSRRPGALDATLAPPRYPTGCLLWRGACNQDGYGVFTVAGKNLRAHRVAWVLAYGDIPAGLQVQHTCNNPACINPVHLVLEQHRTHMVDKVRKGRANWARGEQAGTAKLTDAQALAIYQASGFHRDIAMRYGVTARVISSIKCGRAWAQVTGAPYRRRIKSSRYKGVTWHKASGKWAVYITHQGKAQYCGLYISERDAG